MQSGNITLPYTVGLGSGSPWLLMLLQYIYYVLSVIYLFTIIIIMFVCYIKWYKPSAYLQLSALTDVFKLLIDVSNADSLGNANCTSTPIMTEEMFSGSMCLYLSQPPGFSFRLQKCQDISFSDWALHVPDDGAVAVVHELNTDLQGDQIRWHNWNKIQVKSWIC